MKKLLYSFILLFVFLSCKEEEEEAPTKIQPEPFPVAISKVFPMEGSIGTEIKIEGNFVADTSKTSVVIGDVRCKIKEISEKSILVNIPSTTKDALSILVVSDNANATFQEKFKILDIILSDFSPKSGIDTIVFKIKGKNFGTDKSAIRVGMKQLQSGTYYSIAILEILELSDIEITAKGIFSKVSMPSKDKYFIEVASKTDTTLSVADFFPNKKYIVPVKTTSPINTLKLQVASISGTDLDSKITIGGKPTFVKMVWELTNSMEWTVICPELKPGKYKIEITDSQGMPTLPSDKNDSITIENAEFSFTPSTAAKGSKIQLSLPFKTTKYCSIYEFEATDCISFLPVVKLVNQSNQNEIKLDVKSTSSYTSENIEVTIPSDLAIGNYKVVVTGPAGIYEFLPKDNISTLVVQ